MELALVDETVSQVLKKNELQPHHQYWYLGAMNATFVVRMQDVLAVYERPYHPLFPIVCFDERPFMLHAQPVEPSQDKQAAGARLPQRKSNTYVRQGTTCLLAAFEPGTSQRLVEVSAHRTGADYGRFMQQPDLLPPLRPGRRRATRRTGRSLARQAERDAGSGADPERGTN